MNPKFVCLVVIGSILLGFATRAQQVKLYAYKQAVLPGASKNSSISDLNGKEENQRVARPKVSKFNYFIYTSSAKNITPICVFINGVGFSVKTINVDSSPVVHHNYNLPMKPTSSVLVPRISGNILQLIPQQPINAEKFKVFEKAAASNEIVLVYTYKKKTRSFALPKMSPLEPEALM